jgi:hypothetical protein
MSDKPAQTPASTPSQASDEISEKDLEGVAGGTGAQAWATQTAAKLTGATNTIKSWGKKR